MTVDSLRDCCNWPHLGSIKLRKNNSRNIKKERESRKEKNQMKKGSKKVRRKTEARKSSKEKRENCPILFSIKERRELTTHKLYNVKSQWYNALYHSKEGKKKLQTQKLDTVRSHWYNTPLRIPIIQILDSGIVESKPQESKVVTLHLPYPKSSLPSTLFWSLSLTPIGKKRAKRMEE